MANITRFDPFKQMARFDPFWDVGDFFKGFMSRPILRDTDFEPQIKLDVTEEDKAYTVKAEIPGAKKEDIQVSIEGNQISIAAEVKREKEEKEGRKLVRSERYYGRQYRSFSLAHDIDQAKAEAEYKDGVLQLTLPKKSNGAAKKLTVK